MQTQGQKPPLPPLPKVLGPPGEGAPAAAEAGILRFRGSVSRIFSSFSIMIRMVRRFKMMVGFHYQITLVRSHVNVTGLALCCEY